ncbi:MAG: hypothetical protein Q9224_003299 [Gallowayella concinna]
MPRMCSLLDHQITISTTTLPVQAAPQTRMPPVPAAPYPIIPLWIGVIIIAHTLHEHQTNKGEVIGYIFSIDDGMTICLKFEFFRDISSPGDRVIDFEIGAKELIFLGKAMLQTLTVNTHPDSLDGMNNESVADWWNAAWQRQAFQKKADRTTRRERRRSRTNGVRGRRRNTWSNANNAVVKIDDPRFNQMDLGNVPTASIIPWTLPLALTVFYVKSKSYQYLDTGLFRL